ncbi:MAG: tetraacyldisaccharide 4'-kinase [Deltaproteobacteria bacterium]|nr:MAG: tetraacyldisaccharide 4'-kinase [Deltaproteobacteria bacterium]
MNKIIQYIRTVAMSEDVPPAAFRPDLSVLSGISVMYGGVQKIRSDLYLKKWWPAARLSCGVISIGNLAAGGTGKTPMTDYVARQCSRLGYKTAVLSRGYRGQAERHGGVVSDGQRVLMTPDAAGDEPLMLAASLPGIPVIVGRDRFRSGQLAIDRFGAEIVILDDGFQHLQLERDLDLLLLDGGRPFGNGHLLPRGVLREPPSAISRADAVVLTRTGLTKNSGELTGTDNHCFSGKPVFRCDHQPRVAGVLAAGQVPGPFGQNRPGAPSGADILVRRRVFAFSGIARNDSFLDSIGRLGGHTVGHQGFSDHFSYNPADLADLGHTAVRLNADCMVTTAKDYVRIAGMRPLPLDLVVVTVEMNFRTGRFDEFLSGQLARIASCVNRI